MNIRLRAWQTPNFVTQEMPPRLRQDGVVPAPTFPLSEVDVKTLDEMCRAFRAEVFKKAGKPDPRERIIDEQTY